MRFVLLLLVVPLTSSAQLRFERLTVTDDERMPAVFWRAGRLCVPSSSTRSSCHAVKSGPRPVPRFADTPDVVPRGLLRTVWKGAPLIIDDHGQVEFGAAHATLAQLRCGLGRLREVGWRFVTGAADEVAVLVLEEDDRNPISVRVDAQLASVRPPRRWSILFAADRCADD